MLNICFRLLVACFSASISEYRDNSRKPQLRLRHIPCSPTTTVFRRLGAVVVLLLIFTHRMEGQFASTPQLGISAFSSYQHADIDSVNLSNGNVYVHIPLISFPQLGHDLKLNFIIRFNAPSWAIIMNNVTTPWNTGMPFYTGQWYLNGGITLSYGPTGNSTLSYGITHPVGADIVRDQGITIDNQVQSFMCVANDGTGPASCASGEPEWVLDGTGQDALGAPYYTQNYSINLRDRTGAEHTVGTYGGYSTQNVTTLLSAPDGSGWTPVTPASYALSPGAVYRDRDGISYTTKTITANGTVFGAAADLEDTNGNTITTGVNGWTDSLQRFIPGSYSGPGNGLAGSAAQQIPFEADPFPGVQTYNLSACSAGTSAARIWTVPSANNTTATYTMCYTPKQASTNFQTKLVNGFAAGVAEGTANGLLLTQVILPNKTFYAFTYDTYFNLTSITLPTGGSISYVWSTIPWDQNSLSQPVTRAISSRTVTSSSGQSQTWNYTWLASSPGASEGAGGTIPGNVDVGVDVSKPDGNDELHLTQSVASGGTSRTTYYQGRATLSWNNLISPSGFLNSEVVQHQIISGPFSEPLPQLPPQSNGDTPAPGIYYAPWSFQDQYLGPALSKTDTLDNGSVSQTIYTPVPAATVTYQNLGLNRIWEDDEAKTATCQCLQYGQIASTAEYDYGSGSAGSLLKKTTTTYEWNSGGSGASAYLSANLLDLPYSTVLTGPTGTWAAEADYSYDQSPSPSGARGNLTTTTHVNAKGASQITQTQFNSQGMADLWIDPNGNETAVTSFQCGGLFPKTVVRPYNSNTVTAETTTYSYDCTLGKLNSVKDPNQQSTTYIYNDSLARLTEVQYPDGGDKQVNYNGDPTPPVVTITTKEGASSIINQLLYDGLGRTTETQLTTDPAGSVFQDTTYDPVGRIQSTLNPYRTKSDVTYGITAYLYDGLGRKTDQCQPDNTIAASTTCVPTNSYQHWSYNGNTVTLSDEKKNQWQRTSDALGRLTSVLEPSATSQSPTLATSYTYDALDDLLSVTQSGLSGTDTPRTRSFTYDSLSRLLCASNPENSKNACPTSPPTSQPWPSGTTLYSYDANGNVISKTDARGITTTYSYDALNRLLSKTYSDGSMSSCYAYDSGATNGIGRLTSEWTQAGACASSAAATKPFSLRTILAYDPMGRVASEQQCTPGAGCTTSSGPQLGYGYDLAGNPTCLINSAGASAGNLTQTPCLSTAVTTPPSGLELLTSYDSAGHMNSVTSNWTALPTPLYTLPTGGYGPVGPVNWTLGPNLSVTQSYTNRLWVNGITATGQLP